MACACAVVQVRRRLPHWHVGNGQEKQCQQLHRPRPHRKRYVQTFDCALGIKTGPRLRSMLLWAALRQRCALKHAFDCASPACRQHATSTTLIHGTGTFVRGLRACSMKLFAAVFLFNQEQMFSRAIATSAARIVGAVRGCKASRANCLRAWGDTQRENLS